MGSQLSSERRRRRTWKILRRRAPPPRAPGTRPRPCRGRRSGGRCPTRCRIPTRRSIRR
ncbi:unnamed protein product, partial [Effrenium voratum]